MSKPFPTRDRDGKRISLKAYDEKITRLIRSLRIIANGDRYPDSGTHIRVARRALEREGLKWENE